RSTSRPQKQLGLTVPSTFACHSRQSGGVGYLRFKRSKHWHRLNGCYGSIATDEVEVTRSRMSASPLKADNLHTISASPLCANSRLEQLQQTEQAYSITSSARASSDGGTVRPIVLAVCRLMTNSNLVGCRIGRSAGCSPLRMRPA